MSTVFEHGPRAVAPALPLGPARRVGSRRSLFLKAFCGASMAMFVLLGAIALFEGDPLPAPAKSPAEPLWADAGPSLYRLSLPEIGTAQGLARQRLDGARQDVLVLGEGLGARSYGRLVLHRAGPNEGPVGSFYLDLARMAALGGVAVTRSGLPQPLQTRFGPAEMAELSLSQGERERPCTGLRLRMQEPDVRVTAFVCLPEGLRESAACLFERLELDQTRADAPLAALFARAQPLRTGACVSRQAQWRNGEPSPRIPPISR